MHHARVDSQAVSSHDRFCGKNPKGGAFAGTGWMPAATAQALGPRRAPVGGLKPADWCAIGLPCASVVGKPLQVSRLSGAAVPFTHRWRWSGISRQLVGVTSGKTQSRAIDGHVSSTVRCGVRTSVLGAVGQGSVSPAASLGASRVQPIHVSARRPRTECQLHWRKRMWNFRYPLPYGVQRVCIALCQPLAATPRGRVTPPLPSPTVGFL